MAKKSVVEKVVTTTRTTAAPPVQPLDTSADAPREPDDFDLDVERIIADIGHSGSRCRITRLDDARQQMVGLATVDASQISEEFMQREFGGGTYKIRFRNSAGAWGRQITIVIDRRIPPRMPKWLLNPIDNAAEPTAPAKTNGAGTDSDDEDDEKMFKRMHRMRFLELIEQGDKRRERMDQEALRSSEMNMKMMTTMMETMSSSMASLRAQPNAAPALSFADLLKMQADTRRETMELLKDLRGGNAEANTIDKTLAMMNKLREQSGQFFGDEESGGGGFAALLLELGKALAPALAGLLGQKLPDAAPAAPGTPAAPARLAATTPAAPGTPAAEPSQPETVVPETPIWLTFAKASLLDAAQEGRDPQNYAISTLELVPRPMHGQIREAVMREDAQQLILERVPELETYQVWLAQCIEAFRMEFNPPIDTAGE